MTDNLSVERLKIHEPACRCGNCWVIFSDVHLNGGVSPGEQARDVVRLRNGGQIDCTAISAGIFKVSPCQAGRCWDSLPWGAKGRISACFNKISDMFMSRIYDVVPGGNGM